jgi:hypothetical protein
MPVIYSQLLSIPDAEEAVIKIWRILEEYDMPSPGMTFIFRGNSRVKIALRVDDSVDAQILILLLTAVDSAAAHLYPVRREIQLPRCPRTFRSGIPSRFLRLNNDRRRPHTALRLC